MFLNSINNPQNFSLQSKSMSFQGKVRPPKFSKEQYLVLLTQDIFNTKLCVKMPENELEKETLLEILHHRLKGGF